MLESLEINDNFASRSEKEYAQVAELVDALVSNTCELNPRIGSTPIPGTESLKSMISGIFI